MWQKSSKCDSSSCVEVDLLDGRVLIRNSGDPAGVVAISREAWKDFIRSLSPASED